MSFISRTFKRFLRVNVADLRKGDWIELENGKLFIVHHLASSFSGRGSRSFLLTVKDSTSDSVTTIKPTGRDMFEKLELRDVNCKYLYSADGLINLLEERTFEEHCIPETLAKDSAGSLLEEGMSIKLRMAQDRPVSFILPKVVKCTVAEILNVSDGTEKRLCLFKVRGGAKITSSIVLNVGDAINVDTDDLSYQGRS